MGIKASLKGVWITEGGPLNRAAGDWFGDLSFGSIPEKSIGATGFEPAT
jgi:hypothetical protein